MSTLQRHRPSHARMGPVPPGKLLHWPEDQLLLPQEAPTLILQIITALGPVNGILL